MNPNLKKINGIVFIVFFFLVSCGSSSNLPEELKNKLDEKGIALDNDWIYLKSRIRVPIKMEPEEAYQKAIKKAERMAREYGGSYIASEKNLTTKVEEKVGYSAKRETEITHRKISRIKGSFSDMEILEKDNYLSDISGYRAVVVYVRFCR
jgi:ABC-type Zn uptake system ZnuABC Zn-binding protein ZnuA